MLDDFFSDPELKAYVHEARVTMNDVRAATQDVRSRLPFLREEPQKPWRASPNRSAATANRSPKHSSIALEGLGKVVEELTVLTQSVNNREGTIGQLVHNPELYNNLNRVICNSNQVVLQICELTARLRPIVEDARVFMDKIAREPGRLSRRRPEQGPGIK